MEKNQSILNNTQLAGYIAHGFVCECDSTIVYHSDTPRILLMNETEIRRIFAKSNKRSKAGQRHPVTQKQRVDVHKKTRGTCHFCGGSLGKQWEVDHVVPRSFGGRPSLDNYLPICGECNGIRWSYSPRVIRLMLRFGILVKGEIRHKRKLGDDLIALFIRHDRQDHKRRGKIRTLL